MVSISDSTASDGSTTIGALASYRNPLVVLAQLPDLLRLLSLSSESVARRCSADFHAWHSIFGNQVHLAHRSSINKSSLDVTYLLSCTCAAEFFLVARGRHRFEKHFL